MKFVSYNIQYGVGADGRYDLSRFLPLVAGCDVIALQEVERGWTRTGLDDQPALIAAALPFHHWVYGPALDVDASRREADGRVVNARRQFGTMLLSRLPIVWTRLHYLPIRRAVRPVNTQNAALEAMIRTPAGPVRVFSLHLSHIGEEERLEQIDYLMTRHARVAVEGGPWSGAEDDAASHSEWTQDEPEPEAPLAAIWLGDFNAEPDGAEYRRIVGRQPNRPRAAYAAGFVDAAAWVGGSNATAHTHAGEVGGRYIERRLDYCFVGGPLSDRIRAASVGVGETASDHYPLYVDIDLETPRSGTP